MHIATCKEAVFASQWPIAALRDALTGAGRVVVVAHMNADGDAVGSVLGLTAVLRRTVQATVIPLLPDGCPDELAWLPGSDTIASGAADPDLCRSAIEQADLVVALDVSSLDRTGRLADDLKRSTARKLLIDHHIDPASDMFQLMVSEPEASSTCELVYWTMREAFGREAFDREAATCLYAGICTDTGTLSYSNDRASVYLAMAELLDYGIDPMAINRSIKNVFTLPRLRFFGFAMANRLEVHGDVALMRLSRADIESYGMKSSELTGLINEVMLLRDVDCGILVREEVDSVRLSLRSKSRYDVNQIASRLFGGGGHARAAGATSHLPFEATIDTVKQHFGF